MGRLVIIVPVLNEADEVAALIARLSLYRDRGHRLVIADGGSHDGTVQRLEGAGFAVFQTPRGRARQMNAAVALAAVTPEDILLFLHADTELPSEFDSAVSVVRDQAFWGFFAMRIDGAPWLLRVVERMMTWRSRLTSIATGDQAIFVRADIFRHLGGYPDQPLMEDIALCAKLNERGSPAALPQCVITSGRRWEKHGVLPTILLMWALRLGYFFGADPARLAAIYGYTPYKK